jgi:cytochrome c peroxidase
MADRRNSGALPMIGFKWGAVTAPVLLVSCVAFAPTAVAQISAAELASMKDDYKRPPPRAVENAKLVELGRALFWDPRSSASAKTACVTCHTPELGWVVKEDRSINDSGKPTSRKSQPLIGIGYAEDAVYGWDGRNPSLEAQAKSSIATGSMSMRQTETPVKIEVIEARIRAVPGYVTMYNAALPGAPINIDTIVQAIAAFERTIDTGPAPFDRWVEGEEGAISESAKRGFVLFNTKAACNVCHSGWRFTNDSFHDIGTTTTDKGRGAELKDDPDMQFAFKTPTLRAVALRAPYMNNGSIATLDAVVRHYEKRGIDRPSRSVAMNPIELTGEERADLVAFMETLNGTPLNPAPPELPR